MSITQWTTRLASFLVVLVAVASANAQHHGGAQQYYPQMHQPFIDPHAFDPDYQFFAPAELETFGNGWQAKTGWYGKYDRTNLWLSRPELEPSNDQMDAGWGHRYQLGYMTPDNHGWFIEGISQSGWNTYDKLFIERIDRVNTDDDPNGGNNNQGGGGQGGGQQQQDDALFPVEDRNNPEFDARYFESLTSINVASLNGIELNKSFRLKQFHNGSYLEPFIGFRYHLFNDRHRRDSYQRLDETTFIPTIPQPNQVDTVEEIIITTNNWENHMIGGHIGFHWYTQRPRWQLSSDLKFFAAQNFQSLNTLVRTDYYLYDGAGPDSDIVSRLSDRQLSYANNDEFVWGMDVRAEAAYELTRDVSLTCGLQVVHYVQGIARGNIATFNEEDMTMVGATFGFQVNR